MNGSGDVKNNRDTGTDLRSTNKWVAQFVPLKYSNLNEKWRRQEQEKKKHMKYRTET